jgi:hypothetical protein
MFGAKVLYLRDNLPYSFDFLAFLLGIPRTCRVEDALIGKTLEIPSPMMSVVMASHER